MLANLFVAVILDQFSACADKEGVFGGSGIVDLVVTTVQLRKIAKLIKGRVVRHRHATDGGHAYTSVASLGSPELRRIRARSLAGTGFSSDESPTRDGREEKEDADGEGGSRRSATRTLKSPLAFGSPVALSLIHI